MPAVSLPDEEVAAARALRRCHFSLTAIARVLKRDVEAIKRHLREPVVAAPLNKRARMAHG